MSGEEQQMAYIGRKRCGCVVELTIDDPKRKKAIALALRSWVEDDLVVERVPVEDAREMWGECEHDDGPQRRFLE